MSVYRYHKNPIIKPEDVKPSTPGYKVVCAFNAGVTCLAEEVILLLRVAEVPINSNDQVFLCPVYDLEKKALTELSFNRNDPNYDFSDSRFVRTAHIIYLTSISHFRIAKSRDGINFKIDDTPALFPENEYEVYGMEDARITKIEDVYYINYSASSPMGTNICLVSTKDFKTFKRHGVIFHPDNKDVEIFPEKINGYYYALNRPSSAIFKRHDIWIAKSPDLIHWGGHRYLMGTRESSWDSGRVGGSAVPFKVDGGWLEIYHGATRDDKYCLGAVLLDENEPWKVIARSEKPIIEPETDYEVNGFFGNVIFNCGVLCVDGIIKIYYGAADTFMCYAEIPLQEVLDNLVIQK